MVNKFQMEENVFPERRSNNNGYYIVYFMDAWDKFRKFDSCSSHIFSL